MLARGLAVRDIEDAFKGEPGCFMKSAPTRAKF